MVLRVQNQPARKKWLGLAKGLLEALRLGNSAGVRCLLELDPLAGMVQLAEVVELAQALTAEQIVLAGELHGLSCDS
jgi:hypothetical protein